jgi:hypothetical protein
MVVESFCTGLGFLMSMAGGTVSVTVECISKGFDVNHLLSGNQLSAGRVSVKQLPSPSLNPWQCSALPYGCQPVSGYPLFG